MVAACLRHEQSFHEQACRAQAGKVNGAADVAKHSSGGAVQRRCGGIVLRSLILLSPERAASAAVVRLSEPAATVVCSFRDAVLAELSLVSFRLGLVSPTA